MLTFLHEFDHSSLFPSVGQTHCNNDKEGYGDDEQDDDDGYGEVVETVVRHPLLLTKL